MISESSKDQLLARYKNQAILHANSINKAGLAEFVAIINPPNLLFQVSNACLWILSGIYPQIQVDPITKDPIKQDWNACRKMICQHTGNFLIKLKDIFDEIKGNQNASRHIQKVRQYLGAHPEIKEIKKVSINGDVLYQWIFNVIKYSQILNQNKLD